MAKEKTECVKLQNGETGEDVDLTLAELRDVARGKAFMMMKEVQSLNETNNLIKREIPDKFVQCFQCLAEVLILEERIFSELVKLVGEGEKKGLFSQFGEFADALTGKSEEKPLTDHPLENETIQADVSGVKVSVESEVKVETEE